MITRIKIPVPAIEARRVRIDFATVATGASSLIVNSVAFVGQYWYAEDKFGVHSSRPADFLYAAAIESIAITVSAYAHLAQIKNDSAFRLKLGSYLLGALVGVLNYSHFAGPHWALTPFAVSFGLLSALSPWLWALFSRRRSRDVLLARGLIEERSVRLGAARWVMHPYMSFGVTRLAAWLGEKDPQRAIAFYEQARKRTSAKTAAGAPAAAETATPDRAETATKPRNGNGNRPTAAAETAAGRETETAAHGGSGNSRRTGNGNGTAEEEICQPETPGPQRAETETVYPITGGGLPETLLRKIAEILRDDPGLLDRKGGPTSLGTMIGRTGRRGRQLASAIKNGELVLPDLDDETSAEVI